MPPPTRDSSPPRSGTSSARDSNGNGVIKIPKDLVWKLLVGPVIVGLLYLGVGAWIDLRIEASRVVVDIEKKQAALEATLIGLDKRSALIEEFWRRKVSEGGGS